MREKSNNERRHQWFADSQNYASPSPVTDGRSVVVHFGNGDLAAYDFDGNRLWHRNLQKDYGDYTVRWGHANSPVLCGDLVISICIQDSAPTCRASRRRATWWPTTFAPATNVGRRRA